MLTIVVKVVFVALALADFYFIVRFRTQLASALGISRYAGKLRIPGTPRDRFRRLKQSGAWTSALIAVALASLLFVITLVFPNELRW